jgi:RimJ/RimL family protein N-acetyltransferase
MWCSQDVASEDAGKVPAGFTCRLLGEEEWKTYRAIRLATLADSGDYDRLAEERRLDESHWRAEVTDPANKKFGLFCGEKIIGMTTISLSEKPRPDHGCEFTGSYILQGYRDRKLGNLLYEARLSYLRDRGDIRKALTKVFNENGPSQRVAERNGFICVDTISEDGIVYRVYSRDVKLLPGG